MDVSRGKFEIQEISIPQCQSVAFEFEVPVAFARRAAQQYYEITD